ncbi:hypothetical protein IWW43_001705 [Coemansia sp. RSA 1935]|nr:hypothetical protein J3F82_004986 [Coemansia sp. RSA 637]KAJ2535337.1 hypothetical protein IWW43_001705 [Coemansia sp. RSA 1935]
MHSDDIHTSRPFVFNPSKIRPPQSIRPLHMAPSDRSPVTPRSRWARNPPHLAPNHSGRHSQHKTNAFNFPADKSNAPNIPDVVYSDKSVIIQDSSDDEFGADIELPTDILEQNGPTQDTEDPKEPKLPFDANLDVAQAVAIIKETQDHFSQLSQTAVELLQDMDEMIGVYEHAIEQAAQSQTRYKQVLVGQWQQTKRNSQQLLESTKSIDV